MSLRLGIDTGGTFTDAVLVDDDKQIIAANKSLTTRFDLTIGIGEAIASLPVVLAAIAIPLKLAISRFPANHIKELQN